VKEIQLTEVERLKDRIVLVDTSLLLFLGEGIDVVDQIEELGGICVVPVSVIEELEKLASLAGKRSASARLALNVVKKRCRLLPIRYAKHADDDIIAIALKHRIAVATADKGLRRRLLRKVPTLYLREGQRRVYSEDFFAY